jgi:hypothetical protein
MNGFAKPAKGYGVVAAAAIAATAVLSAGATTGAMAQELSEKSAQVITDYAWSLVPQQFTRPDGKTITVDKKKKNEVVVPIDVAREVIRVGYRSAQAQICELATDQVDNYNSLMRREIEKKKWTDQQLLYISQLHLTTVMLMTGKIKLVEKQGDKEVVVEEGKSTTQACSPDQKGKVKEVIAKYVKEGPAITPAAVVTGPPPQGAPAATGSTTPAPAAAAAKPAAAPAAAPAAKPAEKK